MDSMTHVSVTQPQAKRWSFTLLTVEWILGLIAIFGVAWRHWALLISERRGPFSLVVLFVVAVFLTYHWSQVNRIRHTGSGEAARAAEQGFYIGSTLVILLVVAFGLSLNR